MNFRTVFPTEREDESIYVFVRPYLLAFLPWLAIGTILAVLGVVFALFIPTAFSDILTDPLANNIFVVMISAYFLLILPFMTVVFIDFYYDVHIVTDRRVVDIDQNSLFSRETNELALEEVQDVTVQVKGILTSIFDFGNVTVQTSGTKERFEFSNVLHPREIASIILDLSDQAKRRIEQGIAFPVPQTQAKGVINGVVYRSIEPLQSIGAVVPHNGSVAASPTNEPPTPDATPEPGQPPAPIPKVAPGDDLDIIIDEPNSPRSPK